jgi:acetyl-CoA carboxylase biotin carboxyl carrier protein
MAKAKKVAPKKVPTKSSLKVATKSVPTKKTSSAPSKKTVAPKKPVAVSTISKNAPNAIFNIEEINNLINAVNHSNVNELKLEKGDFKITIRQGGSVVVSQAAPQVVHAAPVTAAPTAPVAAPAPAPTAPTAEVVADNLITIKSPMIGTFYRSSGPGKPVFVNVGDEIKEGQVLCIVEAMKLFNEIESEISGKIVKVLVDDASPIEYDQPLFLVQP